MRTLAVLVVALLISLCAPLNAWYSDGWYGSGDDGENGSGDEYPDYGYNYNDNEQSGDDNDNLPDYVKPSRCIELRDSQYYYPNSYRPQCTATGEFEPMQCHTGTGECWCVDSDGHEIRGTITRSPSRPVCLPRDASNNAGWPSRRPGINGNDDFTLIDATTVPYRRGHHTNAYDGDASDQSDTDVQPLPVSDWRTVILNEPLFLAGLIGGAVLILLLIVLILMFIVYRMRKKDEGSYSLDEPRQSFSYTRAKDQEFFA